MKNHVERDTGDVAEKDVAGDDAILTRMVRSKAVALGADLVGVAGIARFGHAPARMSPQGIMPTARSVVVMAVHHPDAAIELGGRKHPQDIGPYRVQYTMNQSLDEMCFRLGLWLEDRGWPSVPVVSSNIWRYRGYKDLTEPFAPDMSHMHAAVAAGLADFGYSGLALTPEFGARQRYISLITEAPLVQDVLLQPGSLCDNCMLCAKCCPSGALTKELDGWNEVRIEDKVYKYRRKNLWRCSWGEHFDLDLDLPKPEKVTEQVLIETADRHGMRGGEMGCCLRQCVPRDRRWFDPNYTDAPRRRRSALYDNAGRDRSIEERLLALATGRGVDFVVPVELPFLAAAGISPSEHLPDAASAIILGFNRRSDSGTRVLRAQMSYLLDGSAYDLARAIERVGHSAVSQTDIDEEKVAAAIVGAGSDRFVRTATVLTSLRLPASAPVAPAPVVRQRPAAELSHDVRRILDDLGADKVGVADADALRRLHPQLREIFGGDTVFNVRDREPNYLRPADPEVTKASRRVKSVDDHLPGARNVIVIGLRLHRASVESTGRGPAEAIGPVSIAQSQTHHLLNVMALRVMTCLEDAGYRAAVTGDLFGTGSTTCNQWHKHPDAFANAPVAVAAGLGRIGTGGFVLTNRFGPNIRFVAVVTDAPLVAQGPDASAGPAAACADCDRCVSSCEARALGKEVSLDFGAFVERFRKLDQARCDWSKRFLLNHDEGTRFLGWNLKEPVPDVIDEEALAAAVRKHPVILRRRPSSFESCVLACPLARGGPGRLSSD